MRLKSKGDISITIKIDNLSDTRMGLTVTIRPCVENEGLEVSENIERFIKDFSNRREGTILLSQKRTSILPYWI